MPKVKTIIAALMKMDPEAYISAPVITEKLVAEYMAEQVQADRRINLRRGSHPCSSELKTISLDNPRGHKLLLDRLHYGEDGEEGIDRIWSQLDCVTQHEIENYKPEV